MKKKINFSLYTSLVYYSLLLQPASAQCLSGNCENGIGQLRIHNKIYDGIYSGACKDFQPMGQGSFTGTLTRGVRLDSIKEEGSFRYGYCITGQQTVYKNENKDAGETFPYPQVNVQEYTQTNGKGKVIKKWKETELIYSTGRYKGEIKDNVPDGHGVYTVSDRFSFSGTFKDGLPVAIDSGLKYVYGDYETNMLVAKVSHYTYTDIEIKEGLISRLQMQGGFGNATFILQHPKALTQWMFENDDDGIYAVTVGNSTYTGMVNNFKFNGSGERVYQNGDRIKGQFVNNLSHGSATQDTKSLTTEGLFIRGIFVKGTVVLKDSANKKMHFPVCLSGNCSNGTGKASYRLFPGRNNYKYYEGYLVDELPNGYGVLTERKDSIQKTIRGTFVQGLLNGFATYEGNLGVVKTMSGNFEADTLKEGVITYTDGSSFRFTKAAYEKEMSYTANRLEKAIFTTSVLKKTIHGEGTYQTPAGALVQGLFRNNILFEGVYTDAAGNKVKFTQNTDSKDLDYYGQQTIAAIKADEEKKRQEAAWFVMQAKRQAQYEEAAKNPANFREESYGAKCTVCNGKGYIVSGYAVGSISYVSQEYMDNSGNWRRDLKGYVPAHNVTSRTPCEACHKTGIVTIRQKKYIGPSF